MTLLCRKTLPTRQDTYYGYWQIKDKALNNRYNSINALLSERFGERIYKVTLESGFGCPNRDNTKGRQGCSFCSAESLTPTTSIERAGPPGKISEQLKDGIEYVRKRHGAAKVIAYFQHGSNTYAPVAIAKEMFEQAIAHPAVVGLAISTRPDCIDAGYLAVFKALSARTMLWVELGLQSAHDETLNRIDRGHSVREFEDACSMLKSRGIPVCAHVILGLPKETREMMIRTARFLTKVGVWGVKIHNLHVLKGTRMEREYNEGRTPLPDLETYAGWVSDFIENLSPEIVVHRLNAHGPRKLTVAPEWSVNKLAVMNAVHAELARRNSSQGNKL